MNTTVDQALGLVEALIPGLQAVPQVESVLCPPSVALPALAERLRGTPVRLGAQHTHWEDRGAFTGELSPRMLSGLCTHVIVGHSERRAHFGETDETVRRRIHAGLRHGLQPIVCVGESLQENAAGKTAEVVAHQVRRGLEGLASKADARRVVAYEPVWAIGTGRAATAAYAGGVIADVIRPALADALGPDAARRIRVVYGSSVTAAIAAEFFSHPEIDGALVGAASLQPEAFVAIVAAAGA